MNNRRADTMTSSKTTTINDEKLDFLASHSACSICKKFSLRLSFPFFVFLQTRISNSPLKIRRWLVRGGGGEVEHTLMKIYLSHEVGSLATCLFSRSCPRCPGEIFSNWLRKDPVPLAQERSCPIGSGKIMSHWLRKDPVPLAQGKSFLNCGSRKI